MLKLMLQYFGHLMGRADSLKKTLMLGNTEGRRRRERQRMRWLEFNGHQFEQTLGDSEGQGILVYCSPWDSKDSAMTEWLNKKTKQKFLNVDKIVLHQKKMPLRTLTGIRRSQCLASKFQKNKHTFLTGSNATNDFKLKPVFIYYSKNHRAFKNYTIIYSACLCYRNGKTKPGWQYIKFGTLFSKCFKPTLEIHCSEKKKDSYITYCSLTMHLITEELC